MSNAEEFVCAIDIEKCNIALGEGLFAVGLVFADSKGNVLEERCFSSPVDIAGDQFDESTRNFWSQFPDVLERLNENAKTSPLVWENVVSFINDLDKKYGPFGRNAGEKKRKFTWLSDNAGYDIGEVNLMLFRHGFTRPITDMFPGGYVSTFNSSDAYKVLLDIEKTYVDSMIKTPHSHYPTEDARADLERFVAIYEVIALRGQMTHKKRAVAKE